MFFAENTGNNLPAAAGGYEAAEKRRGGIAPVLPRMQGLQTQQLLFQGVEFFLGDGTAVQQVFVLFQFICCVKARRLLPGRGILRCSVLRCSIGLGAIGAGLQGIDLVLHQNRGE